MDFNELEAVMERFMWQSYPQHLQNTLFHAERIAPQRKKSLQERLDAAYEYKKRGDDRMLDKKWREAITQYEFAYGLFKYCDKVGKKITMHDDTKPARELREEQRANGELKADAFTTFWLEVDEMMCSCLTLIATCKMSMRNPNGEDALAACDEALEFRPNHVPALYRRSFVHILMENYSDAVADANEAFRYAPEDDQAIKFDMWKHKKFCYSMRRENTFFWGFIGFVYDLPWTICGLPWTIAAMSPKRQALLVLLLALSAGFYQAPSGSISGLMPSLSLHRSATSSAHEPDASIAANASAVAALDANSTTAATDGTPINGQPPLDKASAAELAAMERKANAAIKAAAIQRDKAAANAAKRAAKEAEKAAKEAKKRAAKEAKEAAKRAAAKAKADAAAAKAKAKADAAAAKAKAKADAAAAKRKKVALKDPPKPAPQPEIVSAHDDEEEDIVVEDASDGEQEDGW